MPKIDIDVGSRRPSEDASWCRDNGVIVEPGLKFVDVAEILNDRSGSTIGRRQPAHGAVPALRLPLRSRPYLRSYFGRQLGARTRGGWAICQAA